MKRIAILVQNLHGGGAERMAANMSIALSSKFKIYLIVFDGRDITYEYSGELIDLKVFPDKHSNIITHFIKFIKRIIKLKKIKKKYNLDCCISHMANANMVNILSKSRKCKVVSVFHDMPSQYLKNNMFSRLIQKFISKHSTNYIVVSKLGTIDMIENFKTNKDKTITIYNFINDDKINKLKIEDIGKEYLEFYKRHDFVMLNVGRMSEQKSQIHLLKVLKELRNDLNVGLIILGNGELKEYLEAKAFQYGIQNNVLFPGEVKNPFNFMAKSDVFVLSSVHEGLPMVLIEAAQCSIPIVSTDMESGAREILAPSTNIKEKNINRIEYAQYGILTPVMNDTSDLLDCNEKLMLEAIQNLLTNDELKTKYKSKSIECAKRFYKDEIIKEWEKIL